MAQYLVINRTTYDIQLIVPPPPSGRNGGTAVTLPPSGAVDILPYAGSIDNCKLIAHIHDLEVRGMVSVVIK